MEKDGTEIVGNLLGFSDYWIINYW